MTTDARFTVYSLGAGNHDDTVEELEKVGAQVIPLERLESEDEIIEQTKDADALIVTESPITRRVLSSLENCKAVLRTGVGFDCIDVPAATDCGIAVINVPDLWTREVANQAMMLLLAANRKLLEQESSVGKTGGRREYPPMWVRCTLRRWGWSASVESAVRSHDASRRSR